MWILGIIAMISGAFVVVVVLLLAGQIVPPIYNVVVDDPTVQNLGYDVGAEVAVRIGLKYVFPLLLIALIIWFLAKRLQRDNYQGYRGRR